MKYINLIILVIFLICIDIPVLHAQQALPATGANAEGTGGTVSYTVGQVFFTTNTGASGSMAQGVQIAYSISVISGIDNTSDIDLSYLVYPNPTTDYLIIKMGSEKISYKGLLFDLNGKLLKTISLESLETKIEMHQFPPAVYFLKIMNNNKVVKTFKIIKN